MKKSKTTPVRTASQTTAGPGSLMTAQNTNAGQGIQKNAGRRGSGTTAVKGRRTCCGG